MLKLNLQCLKKAEPVTKRIPWGSFRFGGPERVVICVFCLVTITSSRTLWHIESRLPRTDSRHFPSNNVFPRSKEPKLTTRFLVNIFRQPGHGNKMYLVSLHTSPYSLQPTPISSDQRFVSWTRHGEGPLSTSCWSKPVQTTKIVAHVNDPMTTFP